MSAIIEDVVVMGAGHVGMAVAAFLSSQGIKVHLFSRRFLSIAKTLTIQTTGSVQCGRYLLASCSTQFQAIASRTGQLPSSIIICCRGNDVVEYARILSKYVVPEMNILLFCGSRLDDWVFRQELLNNDIPDSKLPAIASATSTPFCCCLQTENVVEIKAKKGKISICAQTKSLTERVFATFQPLFETLHMASHPLEITLEKLNDITHIPLMLTAARSLELRESHLFYREVGTRIIHLIECLDRERLEIGKAYGLNLHDYQTWHQAEYHTQGLSIYEHFQQTCAYQNSIVDTLDDRYLTEDVPHGAIPLQALARQAGVNTPVLDGCIAIVSQLIDMPQPWTANFLGIANLSKDEVSASLSHSPMQQILCLPASPAFLVSQELPFEAKIR